MDFFGLGSRSWDWKHFIFCSINDSLWHEICKQNPNQSIAIISRLWYDTCFGRNGDLCISLSLWWRWWDFRWGLHQPGISAALQRSFVKVCDVLTTIAAPVMWIESHKTKTRAKKKKKPRYRAELVQTAGIGYTSLGSAVHAANLYPLWNIHYSQKLAELKVKPQQHSQCLPHPSLTWRHS